MGRTSPAPFSFQLVILGSGIEELLSEHHGADGRGRAVAPHSQAAGNSPPPNFNQGPSGVLGGGSGLG